MKLSDFEKAAAKTRLSAEGRVMARLHLVDGWTLEDAGREVLGITYKEDGVTPVPTRWRAHKAVVSIKNAMAKTGAEQTKPVSLKRVTAKEFDQLIQRTGLGEAARAMARSCLVDGLSLNDAGRPYGFDKRRVHQIVKTVREAFSDGPALDTATVRSSVNLPAGLVVALQGLGEAIESCPSQKRRAETVMVVTQAVKKATDDLR